jgi:DNA polymerase-3 subunit alpha
MGFPGYFLIVADFINWAKANGVPVGPGPRLRRRLAGGLRAGHHRPRSAPYALLFERFLNPERVSMPDFDIDFCQDNRWKVIEYVRQKYGEPGGEPDRHLRHDGLEGGDPRCRPRARHGYNFCDQLSKLIPVVQNKPVSLAKARETEPQLAEREKKEEEVRELLAWPSRSRTWRATSACTPAAC